MTEPVSSSTATAYIATASVLSLFPGIDASVVVGAICGAAVYALTESGLSAGKRLAFSLVSVIAGLVSATTTANILSDLLPGTVQISPSVGALFSSAFSVRILMLVRNRIDKWPFFNSTGNKS